MRGTAPRKGDRSVARGDTKLKGRIRGTPGRGNAYGKRRGADTHGGEGMNAYGGERYNAGKSARKAKYESKVVQKKKKKVKAEE